MRGRRHTLVVLSRGAVTADAEGRATRPADTERTVAGAIFVADARARERGSQIGVVVEAIAELPYADPITRVDQVRVDTGPLAGTWDVTEVLPGPAITRAFLTAAES